jgi:hypothetical protein
MKKALCVSADQEEIEQLGKELDLAIEEYGVRILVPRNRLSVLITLPGYLLHPSGAGRRGSACAYGSSPEAHREKQSRSRDERYAASR